MNTADLPLRERHRLETWAAIRDAAVGLALDDGLAGATIDAISATAGVSRRTFFNYFQCKEDAVLGTKAPTVPEDAIAAFLDVDQGDLFARTVRLLSAVTLTAINDDADLTRRRELAGKFPELRARLAQHVTAAEYLVGVLVEQRMAAGEPGFALAAHRAESTDPAESARALLVLAGAVIRFVYARNSTISRADTPEAVDHAITLFRTIMKEAL